MPKAKAPKNLAVDGTDKLAAKAKPSDKHEKPNLNIEEATVASPRPSRKRAGDYFDFDGEGAEGDDAEASSKPVETKSAPPKKKAKTAVADEGEKKERKGKAAKADTPAKPAKKETKERKPKAANSNAAPKKEKAEPKSKPKKSTAAATKDAVADAAPTVPPDLAMDEEPFEKLVGSEKATESASTKTKKPSKEPKAPKAKAPTTTEKAAEVADAVTKEAKGTVGKAKKSAKANVPTTETPAQAVEVVTKEVKATAAKAKKATKNNAPTGETAADVVESVKKGAKDAADKVTKTMKAKAPTTQTATKATDGAKKQAKAGAEKAKKASKAKDDTKPEASKSKKRKTSDEDAETVKADILDPLTEHAQESAKKKQRTEKAKSKSIGDAVGGLIATAAENARTSLGGIASSLLGGATEAGETAGETAKSRAKKAKGKAKAIASNVAETSSKVGALSPSGDNSEDGSDAEPDDHTAALLAGFESDEDDVHPTDPGFQEGQNLPEIPRAKETIKKLKEMKEDANEGPGVVYVGRIPHGFYEHEMREYFTQFGDINRLRLSRNKKTGASRHWALLEFKSAGVANIVAGTMDNYLMFGHILKCKVVPKEQLHEDVWKGADKRFKKVPWNKMEGRKMEMAVGRDHWEGRIENEKKRRAAKKEKTKEIGYEFIGGALKGVDSVPVKKKKIADGEVEVEQEKSLVTAGGEEGQEPVVVSEEVKTKRTKKSAKGDVKETSTTVAKKTKRALNSGEEAAGSAAKKAKKAIKT